MYRRKSSLWFVGSLHQNAFRAQANEQTKKLADVQASYKLPWRGLEPPPLARHSPQPCASANSATKA